MPEAVSTNRVVAYVVLVTVKCGKVKSKEALKKIASAPGKVKSGEKAQFIGSK